jgi:hypothetical protein
LLRSKVACNNCFCHIVWCAEPKLKDTFRWRCQTKTSASVCSACTSARHGSWFQQRNLTFQEVIFLTYDIVRRVPAHLIQREHLFTPTAIADWSQFCRQTMLEYLDGCSERIGCRNKTVEIDDSKFGRRKYSDHSVKVQWVLATLSVSQLKRF